MTPFFLPGHQDMSAAGRPPLPGRAGQAATLPAGGRCAADAAFSFILAPQP